MTEAADVHRDKQSSRPLEARQPELVDEPLLAVELFRIEPTTVRVAFGGELDVASAPQATNVLASACGVGRSRDVEVDLDALTFCDAAGLRVFEHAQHRCADRGALLALTNPRPLLFASLR